MPDLPRIPLQLDVVVATQLERLAMLAVRRAEAELVVVRLIEELARVQRAVRALLQLDGVRAAVLDDCEHRLRLFDRALVVVADLGDDVAVAGVVDLDAVDGQPPAHRPLHASRGCLQTGEVCIDEEMYEPCEVHLGLPAELRPSLRRIPDEPVQLGRAALQRGIDAYMFLPVEIDVREGALDELTH